MLIHVLTTRGQFEVTCEPEATPASILGGMRARFHVPDSGTFTHAGDVLQPHLSIGTQGVRSGDTVVLRWN